MKRLVSFLLVLAVLCVTGISASAVDYGCTVVPVSKAVYLENLDTGAAVYQKSADERMYPASTTKIMTYVIVADNVSDFDGTTVTIKEELFKNLDPESTVMGLANHVGESYSIRDLLYGMMLPSGNDAALVLADYVGGGIEGFVTMMNSKAAELGCTGTHFANPHGLYDANHYSTARDMATITKYALTTQSFLEITNTYSYTPARFTQPIYNTNYMISSAEHGGAYYYPYVKGVKTGYLDEAGKCLVTTAEKDGFTYLCVALGASYDYYEDINYAMLDSKSLYEWAFTSLGYQTLYGSSEVVKTVNVNFGKGADTVNLIPEGELKALLPNSYDQSLVHVDVQCADSFDAPIEQGQVLGTAIVRYDDMEVGTTNLLAANAVELNRLKRFKHNVEETIQAHMILVIIIGAALLALIILLIVAASSSRKKKAARQRERARRRYR